MSITSLIALALLGGLVGLDVVSFPQVMISRPIVAATLGGAVVGDATAGLLVGVVLELLALETLPVGASRYPEWGSASVVGGALAALGTPATPGASALALLAAVITAWAGGWTMHAVRRINGVWARRNLPSIDAGDSTTVLALQLRGLAADLLRGILLTAIAYALFRPLVMLVLPQWNLGPAASAAVAVGIAAAVAAAAAWSRSRSAPAARWYLAGGVLVGLAVLVLQ
ncbi:MAG TPA: PTS sugar transporter subunit IIC [Gemmatimonadaceae bacterium]|nr:PTS sugar transporter subunit IIC [Gemmatimonadaceae bacterium]